METKRQQQKTSTTKKSDLDLDVFLHSVTSLPIKDINKHFTFNLSDTNDVIFNLNGNLDFNPINFHFKSRVLSYTNGTIQDITFKFRTRLNMQLIYFRYYAPRKKRRLLNHLDLMCRPNLLQTFNIEFYIDFNFLFFFLLFLLSFFFFFLYNFVYLSWNPVTLYCYAFLSWKIWRFFLIFMCIVGRTLSRRSSKEYYQQRRHDSSTEDVTVKEDDSQKLTRSQDSVCPKCVMMAGYDWEHLIEEMNCELAASFGFLHIEFFFFCFFLFNFSLYRFFLFLGVLFWYKIRSAVGP
jgi:hypothetical protein